MAALYLRFSKPAAPGTGGPSAGAGGATGVGNGSPSAPLRLRAKPRAHSMLEMKIKIAVRMSASMVPDPVILAHLSMTKASLSRLKKLVKYKEEFELIAADMLVAMDSALAERTSVLKKTLAIGVQAGANALLFAVNQRRDLRSAIDSAKYFLDKDPSGVFSKDRSLGVAAQGPKVPEAIFNSAAAEGNKIKASTASTESAATTYVQKPAAEAVQTTDLASAEPAGGVQ